jgi:hypothetical protein
MVYQLCETFRLAQECRSWIWAGDSLRNGHLNKQVANAICALKTKIFINCASDLSVRFNWLIRGRYMVIDTDYDSYSIVFSQRCLFWGLIQKQYCWVLGRKLELATDEALMERLFSVIQEQTGLTREEFIQTEHKPIDQ